MAWISDFLEKLFPVKQRVGGDPRGRSRHRTSWVPGPSGRQAREAESPQGLEEGTGTEKQEAPLPSIPPPPPTFCLGESCTLILLIINLPPHRGNAAHPRGPHPP